MFQAAVYRVLIASPSDVNDERTAIQDVIHKWNAENSSEAGIVFLPVTWEANAVPEMGDRPQAIINRQLLGDSDILMGVFWTKLGTPTGVSASGTVEEIQHFIQAGKQVMLYFSKVPVSPYKLDEKQWLALKEFRDACFKNGLVQEYYSIDQLRDAILRHLSSIARTPTAQANRTQPAPKVGIESPSTGKRSDETAGEYRARIVKERIQRIAKLSNWNGPLSDGPVLQKKDRSTIILPGSSDYYSVYTYGDDDTVVYVCIPPHYNDWPPLLNNIRMIIADLSEVTSKVEFIFATGDEQAHPAFHRLYTFFHRHREYKMGITFDLILWDASRVQRVESELGVFSS